MTCCWLLKWEAEGAVVSHFWVAVHFAAAHFDYLLLLNHDDVLGGRPCMCMNLYVYLINKKENKKSEVQAVTHSDKSNSNLICFIYINIWNNKT